MKKESYYYMKHYGIVHLYIGTIGYFVVRTRSNASSKVVSDQGMCMPCQLFLQSNKKMRHMYQMKEQPQLNAVMCG